MLPQEGHAGKFSCKRFYVGKLASALFSALLLIDLDCVRALDSCYKPVQHFSWFVTLVRVFSSYNGELDAEGKPNGEGIFLGDDGSCYEGQWHKGQFHGQGTYISTSITHETSIMLRGNFENGRLHGNGDVIEGPASKSTFTGIFSRGRKHGPGQLRDHSSPKIREGAAIAENLRSHMNNLRAPRTEPSSIIHGLWYGDDLLEGSTHIKVLNLRHEFAFEKVLRWGNYSGEFTFFHEIYTPHGVGVCYYDDGAIYDGSWLEGKWHGQGRLTLANGDLLHAGEFRMGEPFSRISRKVPGSRNIFYAHDCESCGRPFRVRRCLFC